MSFSSGSLVRVYQTAMSLPSAAALVALFLAVAGTSGPAAAQACVSRQQARQLLEQGQAVPFPDALQRAGYSRNQLAGDPQLCKAGGGFVYRVRIVRSGQVSAVSIPAN
jgi:hypothetical protein